MSGGGQSLENKNWIEFKINELFDVIKVNGLPVENYKNGNVPYISTSSINNGLVSFIVSDIKSVSNKNTISIEPIKGKTFYHKYNFVGRGFSGASINLLYDNNINENIALFLCTIIENTASKKSSYGYLFNGVRLKKCKILLPATQQNQPDYKFMENYIKNKMFLKYNKYLQYIKNQ